MTGCLAAGSHLSTEQFVGISDVWQCNAVSAQWANRQGKPPTARRSFNVCHHKQGSKEFIQPAGKQVIWWCRPEFAYSADVD